MNTRLPLLALCTAAAVFAACLPNARAADRELTVTGFANFNEPPVPIALSGYSGEVNDTIRGDLFVVGFKVVPEAEAQYLLKGGNNGQVQGQLTDALNKSVKFSKAYSGGSLRNQAHTLADDVVEAVTGRKGIARTKIAFRVKTSDTSGVGEIQVADYDGFNASAVTADNVIVAAPAWVPGRRMLLYNTYKFGNADIVSHDLGTGVRNIVARYSGSNISPAASPDGRRVAMILSKAGSPDLYVANLDGTGLKQLTQTKEDESSPCWSPDGRWICYATKKNGRRLLAKIPSAGGEAQVIPIPGVASPSEPDWSPDGQWIAFTSQTGGFDICVVKSSGGEARVLVGGEDATWAPNSRTLIFAKRVGGGRRILSLLDVPTKQNKDVRGLNGNCSQPAWAR